MARSYLVLDIETVPDPALYVMPDVAPATAGVEKPFPPLHAHRPIVLGVLWLDEAYRFRRLGTIEGNDEKSMLESFSSFVYKHQPDLVTYNGRSFDLPVLALRSLRHGVAMSWYYSGRVRHRYSEEGHLDLCDMLSDHGAARSLSLDAVARLIGLPGKVGVDGSQVEGLYKAGQLAEVQRYCLADVAQTAFLFLRFRLLQGVLRPDLYQQATKALLDGLAADGRVGSVLDAIDRTHLIGPPPTP